MRTPAAHRGLRHLLPGVDWGEGSHSPSPKVTDPSSQQRRPAACFSAKFLSLADHPGSCSLSKPRRSPAEQWGSPLYGLCRAETSNSHSKQGKRRRQQRTCCLDPHGERNEVLKTPETSGSLELENPQKRKPAERTTATKSLRLLPLFQTLCQRNFHFTETHLASASLPGGDGVYLPYQHWRTTGIPRGERTGHLRKCTLRLCPSPCWHRSALPHLAMSHYFLSSFILT